MSTDRTSSAKDSESASFNEILQDKRLGIHTVGRDDTHSDDHHSPYEPTPYSVLDRMSENGIFEGITHLIDFGSGKGRVGFYLAEKKGIRVTGIEVENIFYKASLKNLSHFRKKSLLNFLNEPAETCRIPADADAFFFFRPFSEIILRRVMYNVLKSLYETPRTAKIIFYYVTEAYRSYLDNLSELSLETELDCRDLFNSKDEKDRLIVYCGGVHMSST